MRILYARNLFRPVDLGGNRYPLEVTTRFAARGHDVRVITGAASGLRDLDGVAVRPYFQYSGNPIATFASHALLGGRATRRTEAEWSPDVTVLSSYDIAYGYWRLSRRRDVPTVFIYHSNFRSDSAIRVARRLGLERTARRFLAHVERTVLGAAERIVAVSPFSRAEISHRLNGRDGKVQVISTGVDTTTFSPGDQQTARRTLDLRPEQLVLVAVGRLAPVKRYDRAITVTAKIARAGRDVVLLIVGDGPERPRLEALASDMGIGDRVRFAGFRDGGDLVAHLRAANLQICTSDFENWSLALSEGLACGTPVVGFPHGGVKDQLEPVDPALVSAESDGALAELILALDRDPARRRDLSARAREYASQFAWDNVVTQLESCLAAIARGAGR